MPSNRNSSKNQSSKRNWSGNRNFASHFQQKRKLQEQNNQNGQPSATQNIQTMNISNIKAMNPLNQYYIQNFIKLKKDADFKNLRNQSFCFKRVIIALSKYPMPILCAQQCSFLEGVGDIVAHKFTQMIQDREQEYEQGIFQEFLPETKKVRAKKNKNQKDKRIIFSDEEDYQFEDDEFINNEQQFQQGRTLKEFLIRKDKQNFEKKNKNNQEKIPCLDNEVLAKATKKRIRPTSENKLSKSELSDSSEQDKLLTSNQTVKKIKNEKQDFLIVGSVSWSLMLALYFLYLHNETKDFYYSFDSITDMLQVLNQQFKEIIPIVSNQEKLAQHGPYELQKFRENSIITLMDQSERDPFQWQILMTQIGVKLAKELCKNVGILVNIEVDIFEKSKNRVTINLYDRHLMPIVQDLYMDDQILEHNANLNDKFSNFQINDPQNKQAQFFKNYIDQIEQEVVDCINNPGTFVEDQGETQMSESLFDDYQLQKILNEKSESQNTQKILSFNEQLSSIQYQSIVTKNYEAEVILMVDNREKRNAQDINYFHDRFVQSQIKTDLKSLPLGDFLWILRVKNTLQNNQEENIEENIEMDENDKKNKQKRTKKRGQKKIDEFIDYVLDFIVERKTADDLAASIMDGRYEEQKFRLKNCGINNVIYLVEGSPGQYCKIPEQVLKKASIHTQIFHGFNVMRISTIQESLKWLTQMTQEISKRMVLYQQQLGDEFEQRIKDTLIDFKQFQGESSKNSNLDVSQIFARQLRTVKGLGIDNCSVITKVFKTPRILEFCYRLCESNDNLKDNLLNGAKLELLKQQYLIREGQIENNILLNSVFDIFSFLGIDEESDHKSNEEKDQINLQVVIQNSTPKMYNMMHKEFTESTGLQIRKINKTQSINLKILFSKKQQY